MPSLNMMSYAFRFYLRIFFVLIAASALWAQTTAPSQTVLHAARLLDIASGQIISPGEVLVNGERIVESGATVKHPADALVIDLGNRTLLPGLIDAHVHLFLHPGAEDLQTVQESVPQRTITATVAARDDLMAGFTAERDMPRAPVRLIRQYEMPSIGAKFQGRALGLAETQSTFWADMKMPSASTPRSTSCQTPILPTTRSN
jgi:hypothetical protein